ncbi:MAG TPA: hypothetical protein VLI41_15055 [Phenylobacterium sp.]|nr:hypothetical protein [Phenylobacterium sp.]HSV04511.1 hypothetical protein [Phenylobacterium sp.]
MPEEDIVGRSVTRGAQPSRWAVAAFLACCGFTAGALFLLVLSWR